MNLDTSINAVRMGATPATPRAAVAPQASDSAPVDTLERGGHPAPAPSMKEWTVLVYAASDNNLQPAIMNNLKDMEKVGSNDQVNVVAQFAFGGSIGSKRYLITKGHGTGDLTSPVVGKLGNVDSASPKTLSDFIEWGVKAYPAKHYMVVVNDHGGGWQGACSDDTHGSWMSTPGLETAFKTAREHTGVKPDVIGFDACLMGDLEVTHQLAGETNFMVGSQETEGAYGWSYANILTSKALDRMQDTLRSRLKMDPKELAMDLVNHAENDQGNLPTMTAFDMGRIPELSTKLDALSDAILASSATSSQLSGIASETQSFTTEADLFDFADRLAKADFADEGLKKAATDVQAAIGNAVIAEQHSERYPGAHGMSIELGNPGGEYGNLKLAHDTSWTKVQQQVNG